MQALRLGCGVPRSHGLTLRSAADRCGLASERRASLPGCAVAWLRRRGANAGRCEIRHARRGSFPQDGQGRLMAAVRIGGRPARTTAATPGSRSPAATPSPTSRAFSAMASRSGSAACATAARPTPSDSRSTRPRTTATRTLSCSPASPPAALARTPSTPPASFTSPDWTHSPGQPRRTSSSTHLGIGHSHVGMPFCGVSGFRCGRCTSSQSRHQSAEPEPYTVPPKPSHAKYVPRSSSEKITTQARWVYGRVLKTATPRTPSSFSIWGERSQATLAQSRAGRRSGRTFSFSCRKRMPVTCSCGLCFKQGRLPCRLNRQIGPEKIPSSRPGLRLTYLSPHATGWPGLLDRSHCIPGPVA